MNALAQIVNLPLIVFVLGLGLVAGLRSMIAPGAVAWAACLGWLHLQDSPFAFMAGEVAVVLLSLGALGELVADKLPATPRRTAIAPLLWRIITGGLSGACLALSAHHSLGINAILGSIGAIIGAFAGYHLRRHLVTARNFRDLPVALCEDLIAICLAVFLVTR